MYEYLQNPKLISRVIRLQSIQKDIYSQTVLSYFEEYDAYKLM